MKIGRNDPCPCGSGIKYKKCCLNKSYEERLAKAMSDAESNLKRESNVKICIHPNKDECSGKIIKAHAIQNNRILNKIAEDGHVITNDGKSNLIFQDSQRKGRKIATTFTGFCSYHDKTLFQDIEDKPFVANKKQIFLITYRTFAWHYHKKQVQFNREKNFTNRVNQKMFDVEPPSEIKLLFDSYEVGLNDNNYKKDLFDKYLLADDYDKVSYYIWEIPYQVSFAISMMHELQYDIKGNLIYSLKNSKTSKSIYLNIFPAEDKSYCVFSWFCENDRYFKKFANQFKSLDLRDKENYLNNNLMLWSDSLVISPKLWKKWGDDIQQAFVVHSNHDILYEMAAIEEPELRKYEYADTPWNLFEKICE